MTARKTPVASVTVRRALRAPRRKVWEAWTSSRALQEWFTSPGHPITGAEVDLRPGGRYVLRWIAEADGTHVHAEGVYREVVEPERLVFTWKSSHAPGMSETLVTVELRERGEETELLLTHEGFDTDKLREEHEGGWKAVLDSLVSHLE